MKKSQLRKLVREVVGGYESDGKGNLVRHNDKFDSTKLSDILMKVAKRPTNEQVQDLYSKEDAIQYIEDNLGAKYYKIASGRGVQQTCKDANQAIQAIQSSPIDQFELDTYGDTVSFSAPYDEKHGAAVRAMGGLD